MTKKLGTQFVLLLLTVGLSGCCGFLPCDRLNHVGGYVVDTDGRPIPGAAVDFFGVTRLTDNEGCFFFGGTVGGPGFQIDAKRDGYKKFSQGRRFDFYEVNIVLEKEGSTLESRATWKVIASNQLKGTPSCRSRY